MWLCLKEEAPKNPKVSKQIQLFPFQNGWEVYKHVLNTKTHDIGGSISPSYPNYKPCSWRPVQSYWITTVCGRLNPQLCVGENPIQPPWIYALNLIWLVVSTPLKNMQVSWDVYILFPIYEKRKNVPNHQPVMYITIFHHEHTMNHEPFILMIHGILWTFQHHDSSHEFSFRLKP